MHESSLFFPTVKAAKIIFRNQNIALEYQKFDNLLSTVIMVPERSSARSVGKFVYHKISKIRFRPDVEGTQVVTGSWDDEVLEKCRCMNDQLVMRRI